MRHDPTLPPRLGPTPPAEADWWPIYFARHPIAAPRVELAAGDQFPHQNKPYLRGLGRSFGCVGADTLPFDQLRYIGALRVPRALYGEMIEQKWPYAACVARLGRWRATQGGSNPCRLMSIF